MSNWQTLLTDYALGRLDPSAPGVQAARLLFAHSRRANTTTSYDGKWLKFVHFCTTVQTDAGFSPLCACPASSSTVLAYLGWLLDEGSVHAKSLQPYLSAINSFHADQGLDRPAVGHFVALARRGFDEIEGTLDPNQATRQPLPASVAWAILCLGLSTPDMATLRLTTCVVLQFAFFARSDTGAQAQWGDVRLDAFGLHWRERTKTLARTEPATLTVPPSASVSPSILDLFQRYRDTIGPRSPDSPLWMLPSECRQPRPASVEHWLQAALGILHITPPPGVSWSSHSLRSGGATAALSIGADVATIARWGLWKDLGSLQVYLDPLVGPSSEALAFFGHLRKLSPADLALLPPPRDPRTV